MTGQCKSWISSYGFIRSDEEISRDVFVHFTELPGDGYRILEPGERVRFDVRQTAKGLMAFNVERLEERAESMPAT